MQRSDFLGLSAGGAAALLSLDQSIVNAKTVPTVVGDGVKPVDDFIAGFMKKWEIPAVSAAVSKDGRLVYARGYGHADLAKTIAVTADHRFRIASSSKPITAVGIMKLVQEGRLKLDAPAFELLPHLPPPPGKREDPLLKMITIRHLLEHSGGFDSTKTDPQFDALRSAADAVGHARPASHSDIIRYVRGEPLAFTPGSKYLYSNFGYNVLGRVIEVKSGMAYGDYIRKEVLGPAAVLHMELGRTKPQDRLPREVEYWDDPYNPSYYSVYEDDPVVRTYSYGGFAMEAIDAHGGWVARPLDLTRFLDSVAGHTGNQLLKPEIVQEMLARPNLAQYRGSDKFYSLGWDVRRGKTIMAHNGALTWGTASTIARLPQGLTFAMCCNKLGYALIDFVESLANDSVTVINKVRSWPDHDLYASYP